jgi:ATP-binding cassette subfamily B protein
VGPTGAGKTTLVNLLVRFIDPTMGSILLDGQDLRDYRLADLRRQFAVLGQEALLISGTIEENIAYARPGASREDVVRAATLAQAHQFIETLPQGYDTAVGEGGLKLSGGERQRVALARAYLKDAPILILDEPTSALDMNTENHVIEGLKRIMAGRTVFLITHRPSALQAVDMILHVENGSIDVTHCYEGAGAFEPQGSITDLV